MAKKKEKQKVVCPRETDADEEFWAYHEANLGLYDALYDLCVDYLSMRPGTRWSVDMAFYVYRWNRWKAALPDDGFKINDKYSGYYARLLMEREPAFDNLFELRIQRARLN